MTDLDRITSPLRLAEGSHKAGSGKGCAMNAVSWVLGDEEITDFPECTDYRLASFIQDCNDHLCDEDGLVLAECSLPLLQAAFATVGTAEYSASVNPHQWMASLLKIAADKGIDGSIDFIANFRFKTYVSRDTSPKMFSELVQEGVVLWREMAGMDKPQMPAPDKVNTALRAMAVVK